MARSSRRWWRPDAEVVLAADGVGLVVHPVGVADGAAGGEVEDRACEDGFAAVDVGVGLAVIGEPALARAIEVGAGPDRRSPRDSLFPLASLAAGDGPADVGFAVVGDGRPCRWSPRTCLRAAESVPASVVSTETRKSGSSPQSNAGRSAV